MTPTLQLCNVRVMFKTGLFSILNTYSGMKE